jgi:Cytochrome c
MHRQRRWWTVAGAAGAAVWMAATGLTVGLSAQAKAHAQDKKTGGAARAAGAGAGVTDARAAEMIERGRYLVVTGGCNDCHTPWQMTAKGPAPDMTRMLSGHPESMKVTRPPRPTGEWIAAASATNTAWAGPWGVSFTANLTPDRETGLGNWTEEMFISTLRTGKHAGVSRPLLPPMPWPAYAQMTDRDLKAIFAYLKSIKPIKNMVPAPVPPMPAPAS